MSGNHKSGYQQLEHLLEGLEDGLSNDELQPLVESASARLVSRPGEVPAPERARRLREHLIAVHEERIGELLQGACLRLLYQAEPLRLRVYSERDGGPTAPAREPLESDLGRLLGHPAPLDLLTAARLGQEVQARPEFIVYEALGQLGRECHGEVERLLAPLVALPDYCGVHASAYSCLGASAGADGRLAEAAELYLGCPEQHSAAQLAELAAFFYSIVAGQAPLSIQAGERLRARERGCSSGEALGALGAAFVRRLRATFMGQPLVLTREARSLILHADRHQSETAERVIDAIIAE